MLYDLKRLHCLNSGMRHFARVLLFPVPPVTSLPLPCWPFVCSLIRAWQRIYFMNQLIYQSFVIAIAQTWSRCCLAPVLSDLMGYFLSYIRICLSPRSHIIIIGLAYCCLLLRRPSIVLYHTFLFVSLLVKKTHLQHAVRGEYVEWTPKKLSDPKSVLTWLRL